MRKSLNEFNSVRKDGDADAEIKKIIENAPAREEIVETSVQEQIAEIEKVKSGNYGKIIKNRRFPPNKGVSRTFCAPKP